MWFLHPVECFSQRIIWPKESGKVAKKCCFCNQDESIQHLFFVCPMAKVVYRIVYMDFNIIPPKNINNLFENWLAGKREDLVTGCNRLKMVAQDIYSQCR
jgi:hypothetical protein